MYKAAVRTSEPSEQKIHPLSKEYSHTDQIPSVCLKTCEYYGYRMLSLSTVFALCLTLAIDVAFAGSVLFNSNAIKNIPGVMSSTHAVSVSPDELTLDSGTQNLALDTLQVSRSLVLARCRTAVSSAGKSCPCNNFEFHRRTVY